MRTAILRTANAARHAATTSTSSTPCPVRILVTSSRRLFTTSPRSLDYAAAAVPAHEAPAPAPGPLASTRATSPPPLPHAISNPTLADIEKRWEVMPPPEQAELWMALRKRMKVSDWSQLTWQEKRAAYYIAFGPHGPRKLSPPGEWWMIMGYSAAGVAIAVALFLFIRLFARPPPSTMTKEWEELTNEYLRSQNSEPITGISSEGYTGKGYVQSAPAKKN